MGMDKTLITAGQIADNLGIKPDTMARTVRRKLGTGIGLNGPLSADQVSVLTDKKRGAGREKRDTVFTVVSSPRQQVPPQSIPSQKPAESTTTTRSTWRVIALIVLMLIPTAASIQNMYTITFHIGQSHFKAVLLTAMLSLSALGFAAVGIRRWYTLALAIVLIAFESFCNLTAIYDGLMGGIKANPTRFLGVVTDIFNGGSYGAALTLGVINALLIAAVQFTALINLKSYLEPVSAS